MDRLLLPGDASELAVAGGPVDKFSVTLAVYHPELDPDEVSSRLGVKPTAAHRRGESRGPKSPPLSTGGWFLRREAVPPMEPSAAVIELLSTLPKDRAFWDEFRCDYKVQVRVAVHTDGWNRGFSLAPSAIACVAATGIEIDFDLYFYGSEYEA